MDIAFKSRKLEKTFNSDRDLQKEFGRSCAKKIRARFDDLFAAATLEVMRSLPGRCHELKGDRKGQLSLDLEHPLRLLFEPTGDGVQKKEDGGLDWTSVRAIEILGVEDTHD